MTFVHCTPAAAFSLSPLQTVRGQISPTYVRRPNPVERPARPA